MARVTGKLLPNSTGGMMLRVALLLAVLLASPLAWGSQRVVSVGGTVTEIVYALGEGHRLVADDASSVYPPEATQLPRVGYYRDLSLEGILSKQPDLLLASENAGPPEVIERLRAMGVNAVSVSDRPGVDSLYERVDDVAAALGAAQAGEDLKRRIRASLEAVGPFAAPGSTALVVVHRGGPLQAAGAGTSADALLKLAGYTNAAAASNGYKPVSEEALAALAPDVIVTTTTSVESSGGLAAFRERPGVAMTPAGQAGQVVAIDDLLLLGMGPRVAQAVTLLREAAR